MYVFIFCWNLRYLFIGTYMRANDSSLPSKKHLWLRHWSLNAAPVNATKEPGRLPPWCHECVAVEIQHRQLVGAAARVSSTSVQVKAHSRRQRAAPGGNSRVGPLSASEITVLEEAELKESTLNCHLFFYHCFKVCFQWKYDIFGASPPWIERGCSLRATERRGSNRIPRFSFPPCLSFFFWPNRGGTVLRTALRWRNREVDPAPTSDPLFLRFLSAVAKVSVGSCAGILSSAILFSPRFLLPGQMHTNAFRSSTDKEWTRFRGSNVSQHSFIYVLFFYCFVELIDCWKLGRILEGLLIAQ